MKAETMLVELELKLPEPPPPRGNYIGAVQHDSLLFISGQFPLINGQLAYRARSVEISTLQMAIGPHGYAQ